MSRRSPNASPQPASRPRASRFRRGTYRFEYPIAPAEVVAEFRDYYGPTMNAFDAAEANGRTAELERELVKLFEGQNESGDDNTTSIPAMFLRVTVSL